MPRPPEPGAGAFTLRAPAKVNLYLEVLHRRPDGFHALETLMVAVSLFDTLEFMAAPELTLTCSDPSLPTGADNLVIKAADALRRHSGVSVGAAIHLTKEIPSAAGVAGGSSDAATAVVGLNRLWNLNLDRAALAKIAAEVGSDVAFFLSQPAGWCTGRGEVVEPIALPVPLHLVLVCPMQGLSTAAVYKALTPPATPKSGAAIRAALATGDLAVVGRELFNRLQEPADTLAPQLRDIREAIAALGPLGTLMSGSGSTLFALCTDATHAADLARRLRSQLTGNPRVFVVRTLV